jgi:thiamine pyrophosphate-dependent acetolactate synthase large subunit-like protein
VMTAAQWTGGALVVDALVRNGVDLVFGIPGTHNLEIYRSLSGSGIRHVAPRHEQGGGYAADAYARVSGRPGVLLTTTGPGLTNACTAAATAHADSVPMLLISPGVPRGMERRDIGWLHEVRDQHAHMAALVDSHRVDSAAEAAAVIDGAFARWKLQRPRPVHVEVPVDVLSETVEEAPPTTVAVIDEPSPSEAELASAAEVLTAASSVLIVAGGGARTATAELREVAEWLDAPVLTTVNGKGALPEDHRLSLGASIRLPEAYEIIRSAAALLVVGSVLGDDELWGNVIEHQGPVVRIDVDASQLHKNLDASHPLHGRAKRCLRGLREQRPASVEGALGARAAELRARLEAAAEREGAPFAPWHEALRQVLPVDAIIAGDSAQVSYFGTAHQWPAQHPGQFVYPAGYATLGYGIPGGIGAALAAPRTPVAVVAGDGGTMFSIQEFATAVDLGLPLPVVVMNNGGFQEIREGMEAAGIAPLAVDVRSPDWPMLGRALGGAGVQATTPAALAAEVTAALARDVPTLIEVPMS